MRGPGLGCALPGRRMWGPGSRCPCVCHTCGNQPALLLTLAHTHLTCQTRGPQGRLLAMTLVGAVEVPACSRENRQAGPGGQEDA